MMLLCCSYQIQTRIQMGTGSIFSSLLRVAKCKTVSSLANYWDETFGKTYGKNSSVRLLCSRKYGLGRGLSKQWTQRSAITLTEGKKQTTQRSKARNIKNEILSEAALTSATEKPRLGQFQEVLYCDLQQEIAQNKDLSSLVTIIVYDIETTGFKTVDDGIVEIALRDLQGGENSTFQTLVNPQRSVRNSRIHGIKTEMVLRPDIPRMEDLIPILLQYVQSRRKPGGYVLWVAHNARRFDLPFLANGFSRCSIEIPPNWLFLDSLSLARELMKSEGTKLSSASLAALREFYGIRLDVSDHRAMVDVNTLSMILSKLTYDLKLTISDLILKSFTYSDFMNSKRKKNKS